MPATVLIAKCLIHDPWFFGENVNLSTGAKLLGHLGMGNKLFLARS